MNGAQPADDGGHGQADEPGSPTLLRALIIERHWQKFATFKARFERAAKELAEREGEEDLAKLTISSRQWARWYSGNVKTEPYPDACRVLEHLFCRPVRELLAPVTRPDEYAAKGELQAMPTSPLPDIADTARIVPYLDELRQLSEQRLSSAYERERTHDRLVELLSEWADTVKRREFVQVLGWAATATAAISYLDPAETERIAHAIAVPARVDATAIDHIEAVLWHAKRQDDMLGPQAALHTVLSQRNVILGILNDCPAALRPRLLSVLASASRIAGWLSFDAGDHQGAWFYFEKARAAAHESRDTALAGYVLCNMSHLATWQGTPRIGIDHAVAAQGWARQTDDKPLQAYAHQVAARAYAADGQDAALRELESAEALIGSGAVMRSVVHYSGAAEIASDWSKCHLALGNAAWAADAASQALEHYDRSFVRNRALIMLNLAQARLKAGEIAEAANITSAAVDLSTQNRSPRLADQVRQSVREFGPWPDAREVRELADKCVSLGITSDPR